MQASQARRDPAHDEIVAFLRQTLDEVQALLDERVRLRALVLDFLKGSRRRSSASRHIRGIEHRAKPRRRPRLFWPSGT